MADDAFEETLAGFRRWAGTTERKLSGDPEEDAAELYTVFSLMPDYLGIDAPSRLTAGSLNELLLHVYPRKVTVLDRKDVASTIPALRDLTSYLADTGAITAATERAMDRELDEVEPDFADAVMDPSNWGLATAMMHAMHRDGVDISDSAAVDSWIAQQNAGVLAAPAADPLTWDGIDLKEAFGIPDVVAPVRLPDDEALTALAGAAPLLSDLRGLARDVRETPVRAATVDSLFLGLAVECELVERDGDTLVPGEDVEWLDDLAGGAALDAWDYAFAQVLDTTLEAAGQAEPQAGEDLDLAGPRHRPGHGTVSRRAGRSSRHAAVREPEERGDRRGPAGRRRAPVGGMGRRPRRPGRLAARAAREALGGRRRRRGGAPGTARPARHRRQTAGL